MTLNKECIVGNLKRIHLQSNVSKDFQEHEITGHNNCQRQCIFPYEECSFTKNPLSSLYARAINYFVKRDFISHLRLTSC